MLKIVIPFKYRFYTSYFKIMGYCYCYFRILPEVMVSKLFWCYVCSENKKSLMHEFLKHLKN